jgi:hypothetical protein
LYVSSELAIEHQEIRLKVARARDEIEMEQKSMGGVFSRFRGTAIFALPGDDTKNHHAEDFGNKKELFDLRSSA